MTRPSQINAADQQRMVLRETLRLAVPLHMAELRDLPARILAAIASDAATVVGSKGDALQFGGKGCAGAFNALARGLAAAALTAEGGVDFVGLHWCRVSGCRAGSRFEHAPPGPGDAELLSSTLEPVSVPAQRRVVDLPSIDNYRPDPTPA